MEIFCFLLGILFVYTSNLLSPLISVFIFIITPRLPVVLLFILGALYALFHLWLNTPSGFPDVPVLPHAIIQGTIASIPNSSPGKTQFVLATEQLNGHPAQGLVQLAWYNKAPPLKAGQSWRLHVKLKKPRNFNNPGSFDYVNALASRHISWAGYINNKGNQLITNAPTSFNLLKLREQLANAISRQAPDRPTTGILEALTLNMTTHIDQKEWDLFRRTGTTHLFGISGEHIALISGLVFWIVKTLWSRSPSLCLRIPAPYPASVCGFIIAILYAFLAGFAPPVQRALVGCFFFTVYSLGKQRFTPWQVWRYALFTVLCIEPHAVFMQGFYFSFLAVACLLITQQRWQLKGLKGKLALQLSCLIGLLPLSLYWYAYGSINGFIANLFAIPLVGLLIVPLSLITMLVCSYSWSWLLMKPLAWLVTLLFTGLSLTEKLAVININYRIASIELTLILMGAMLLLVLLPIKPMRWIAGLWLILPLFPPKTTIHQGEALIQILDVGQGLAVSIQTQNHVLLYDTGDQFFQGSDFGNMVILPFYKQAQLNTVDKIVISHPDKDHRGGLNSVEQGMVVHQLLVNTPKFYHRGINCHYYPGWNWDGVSFHFFPITKAFKGNNNNSCILQISTKAGKLLLTGDIEKIAEEYLVKSYAEQLKSDILILPHHGSKTSSSFRFLLEVAPQFAIASLGFDNRFHFPHAKTLASLSTLKIPFYRTDECGMTQFVLPNKGTVKPPKCYTKT